MPAAVAAGSVREALDALEGDLAGPDEGVRGVLGAGVLGQEGLPDGPPGVLAVGGEESGQVLAEEGPAVLVAERFVEGLDELEAGFEGGGGALVAAAPGLVLAEKGGDPFDGVAGGVGEDGGGVGGAGLAGAREDLGEVEEPGLVRLARRPEGGVAEELREEVDDTVAEIVADAGGVVAGAPEVGVLDGLVVGQAVAVLPDAEERLPGLVEDLVARPGLEVDRALGLDLLAGVDLPGVGPVVGDERLGVEEVEHVALDGGVRPGLFLEEADGGLVAVEGRAELAFLDQGPGPEGDGVRLAGLFADPGALSGRGLELLFVDEFIDGLAGGLGGLGGSLGRRGSGSGQRRVPRQRGPRLRDR